MLAEEKPRSTTRSSSCNQGKGAMETGMSHRGTGGGFSGQTVFIKLRSRQAIQYSDINYNMVVENTDLSKASIRNKPTHL